MKYNPYYNQEEFQKYKYYDQPTLQLLDWILERISCKNSSQEPERLRRHLRQLLLAQIESDLVELDLSLTITEEYSYNSNECFELSLNVGGLVESRATLAVPSTRNANAPVFLCLHGHQHEGRRWTLEEGPAAALTNAGYTCLVPDLIGLGESRGVTDNMKRGAITYDLLVHNALLIGWSLNGLRLWMLEKWMQILKENEKLAKTARRFACAGFSLGGELALYLSAVHTEIAPVYISHYCCPWEASYWSKLHCECAYVPGLIRLTNLAGIYKLIAPRALAVEIGREDKSFPWKDTEQLMEEIREYYVNTSAAESFHQVVKSDDHVFRCEPQTLKFLAQHAPG